MERKKQSEAEIRRVSEDKYGCGRGFTEGRELAVQNKVVTDFFGGGCGRGAPAKNTADEVAARAFVFAGRGEERPEKMSLLRRCAAMKRETEVERGIRFSVSSLRHAALAVCTVASPTPRADACPATASSAVQDSSSTPTVLSGSASALTASAPPDSTAPSTVAAAFTATVTPPASSVFFFSVLLLPVVEFFCYGFTLQIVIIMPFMLGYGLHYPQTPIHYVINCTINILYHHGHHHNCWPSSPSAEMGSCYVVESGVFMSSLSATIFIVALVIIGVLMLTLLIALTVMLQSCKRSGSGVFDDAKKSNHHDHCNLFIFHAELNNLAASEIPIICKLQSFQFSKERYLQDLNTSLWFVEEYFSTLKPDKDGLDAILLDADDILSSTENLSSISSLEW
ncbi:hypothetical protein KSP40_PGU021330 [Platanthera guangdongensis]|uniref:Uncharacterized protein n=1 Tax=Platanthera guangdongensis TaxID=2320717 RepID=A0ABR2LJD0_9ASPA